MQYSRLPEYKIRVSILDINANIKSNIQENTQIVPVLENNNKNGTTVIILPIK